MAKKTVYLIRHGRTKGNAEKRFIGNRTDEMLSDAGVEQAESLRKNERSWTCDLPDRICASPMKRALQTGAILYDTTDIQTIDELKEMDFGFFERKNHWELDGNPAYQAWIDGGGKGMIPGGEDFDAFCERSFAGFQKALGDPLREETVSVICHGGTIMAVMSKLTGKEFYDFLTENLGGYYMELECGDAGMDLISYDSLPTWDRP